MQHARQVGIGVLENILSTRSLYLVGRAGEHEKLFDTSYDAAVLAVRETLLPALASLAPGTEQLITLRS